MLLENYRGDPGKDPMEEFIDYCVSETGFERRDVVKEVERMLDNGCMAINPGPGAVTVSWL